MGKKTYETKEYVWYLDIDNEDKIFKCVVTDTECITYEGEQERKHLKITNPVRKNKVLQIDTITSIYGQMIPFQLENGVPYIQINGSWQMSETNRQERIAQNIKVNKNSSFIEIGAGVALIGVMLVKYFLTGDMGKWWFLSVMGAMLVIAGCSNLARLKTEMGMMKEAEAELAREKEEARAAARKQAENG